MKKQQQPAKTTKPSSPSAKPATAKPTAPSSSSQVGKGPVQIKPLIKLIEGFTAAEKEQGKVQRQVCGEGNETPMPSQTVIVGPLPPTDPKIIVINVDLVDVAAPKKSVCFLEQRMKIPNEEEVQENCMIFTFDNLVIDEDIKTKGKKFQLKFTLIDGSKTQENTKNKELVLGHAFSCSFDLISSKEAEQAMKKLSIAKGKKTKKAEAAASSSSGASEDLLNEDEVQDVEVNPKEEDDEDEEKLEPEDNGEEPAEEDEEEEDDQEALAEEADEPESFEQHTLNLLDNINEAVKSLSLRLETVQESISSRLYALERRVEEFQNFETPKLLIYQLCYETKMNVRFAEKCLQDNGWSYPKALEAFKNLKEQLPAEAFEK